MLLNLYQHRNKCFEVSRIFKETFKMWRFQHKPDVRNWDVCECKRPYSDSRHWPYPSRLIRRQPSKARDQFCRLLSLWNNAQLSEPMLTRWSSLRRRLYLLGRPRNWHLLSEISSIASVILTCPEIPSHIHSALTVRWFFIRNTQHCLLFWEAIIGEID